MAETKIEWTDFTWNPIRARLKHSTIDNLGGAVGWHCVHVSEGCRNCYAEGINRRLGTGLDYKPGNQNDIETFLDEKTLLQPLKWRKPRRIFVCSMSDLFGAWVTDDMLDRIFAVMALCPQHTFQVLTKRPERMLAYVNMPSPGREALNKIAFDLGLDHSCGEVIHKAEWPLPNVWLGVSCEDQSTADERIPLLLQTPAAVRFISAEPLLGAIDLTEPLRDGHPTREQIDGPLGMHYLRYGAPRLDWVIVGGESGPKARPMHPDWARSLRDQCKAAGVAYLFKQWGEWLLSEDGDEAQYKFQDGTDFWNVSDGADIVIGSAMEAKEPTKIWRNLWGDGCGHLAKRAGKKAAGRLLDGIEHNEFPRIVAITPQSEEERADV